MIKALIAHLTGVAAEVTALRRDLGHARQVAGDWKAEALEARQHLEALLNEAQSTDVALAAGTYLFQAEARDGIRSLNPERTSPR
jgi:hypothetical protein